MDGEYPIIHIVDPSPPGRNDPCPCGSGLKYKKCHLAKDEAYEPCSKDFWEVPCKGQEDCDRGQG